VISPFLQIKVRGYAIIDNFFSKETCIQLREVALSERYVNLYHKNGYKASDFDNGNTAFGISPQAVCEIKRRAPLLKNYKYVRSWSFVYDNICSGVNAHADTSTYNINWWATPDECVHDHNKNGLIIFKKHSYELSYEQYNIEQNFIDNYLSGSKSVKIPYKFNRAIIFPGRMFHKTDEVHMKSGKENRRINYTFLFE
jgi:hypothetical protein|tara:strand:- start:43 stop:636 length:594 start_codon:yes stop_codon:yes gene_type:complete